jgi:N6-adenosine-specific RNA methylase IME4
VTLPYDVILADPPWRFQTWSDNGKGRSPERHYPCMSIEDICRLPVEAIAAENCALFLWYTKPLALGTDGIAPEPQRVIEAWGFRYATMAWTWVKLNPSGMGVHMGTGYYTRGSVEFCALAVRGIMPVAARDEVDVLMAPVREHSRKPDEQYGKIERLYPNARYVELFARQRRPGWDAWGNEVKSSIALEAAP